MRRIYGFYFYRLAVFVHDLTVMQKGLTVTPEVLDMLVMGANTLKDFQTNVDPVRLRSSIAAAVELEKVVRQCLQTIYNNATHHKQVSVFSSNTEKAAKSALQHFEAMLQKELNDFPLYGADEKGMLSLPALLDGASKYHATEITTKLSPRIVEEIDEGGKCLAFSRPTAAAFHILRALELLIAKYIGALGLQMPPPNRCNWGEYIQILRNGKAAKQVTDLLQIIKDDYRNPIMHPDDTLNETQAVSLFNLVQSAIEITVRHMP